MLIKGLEFMTYEHLKTELIGLGGGCEARVVYLGDNIENKKVVVINEESVSWYDSIDDFWLEFDRVGGISDSNISYVVDWFPIDDTQRILRGYERRVNNNPIAISVHDVI